MRSRMGEARKMQRPELGPRMDREKFYKDTFEFSDKTKKYALSKIKSVLTALGCS